MYNHFRVEKGSESFKSTQQVASTEGEFDRGPSQISFQRFHWCTPIITEIPSPSNNIWQFDSTTNTVLFHCNPVHAVVENNEDVASEDDEGATVNEQTTDNNTMAREKLGCRVHDNIRP